MVPSSDFVAVQQEPDFPGDVGDNVEASDARVVFEREEPSVGPTGPSSVFVAHGVSTVRRGSSWPVDACSVVEWIPLVVRNRSGSRLVEVAIGEAESSAESDLDWFGDPSVGPSFESDDQVSFVLSDINELNDIGIVC